MPRGKKRTNEEEGATAEAENGGTENGATKVPKVKKTASREEIPSLEFMDFSSESKTTDGKPWNLKIASWNINGIRAWMEKNGISYLTREKPDILCLQETKCDISKIPETCKVDGYHAYWSSGDQEGYAGTGLYSKTEPISVTYGIGVEKHDKEGRVITAEYDQYYVVTAYVPNSGRGLPRLDYRIKEWDVDYREYLKKLDEKKPVIMCGDLNVAHQEIDLKNPKGNKKTPGFTPQERESFTEFLSTGFFDSFRHLYPEQTEAYTFWTYMGNARAKNVGWRLDYFALSERLKDNLCDSVIRKDVMGSDHCPITLFLAM